MKYDLKFFKKIQILKNYRSSRTRVRLWVRKGHEDIILFLHKSHISSSPMTSLGTVSAHRRFSSLCFRLAAQVFPLLSPSGIPPYLLLLLLLNLCFLAIRFLGFLWVKFCLVFGFLGGFLEIHVCFAIFVNLFFMDAFCDLKQGLISAFFIGGYRTYNVRDHL